MPTVALFVAESEGILRNWSLPEAEAVHPIGHPFGTGVSVLPFCLLPPAKTVLGDSKFYKNIFTRVRSQF